MQCYLAHRLFRLLPLARRPRAAAAQDQLKVWVLGERRPSLLPIFFKIKMDVVTGPDVLTVTGEVTLSIKELDFDIGTPEVKYDVYVVPVIQDTGTGASERPYPAVAKCLRNYQAQGGKSGSACHIASISASKLFLTKDGDKNWVNYHWFCILCPCAP